MKKIFSMILSAVVLVLAGMPVVSGMIMENQARQTFEDFNAGTAASGSDLRLVLSSYDRGLYASDIQWEIQSRSLGSPYGVDRVILTDHVGHGFLGCRTRTSLERNKWYADMIATLPDRKDPLRMTTEFHLTGRMTTTLALPDPVTIPHRKETLIVQPVKAVIAMGPDSRGVRADITIQGLEAPGAIFLKGFSCRYEQAFDPEKNRGSIGFQARLDGLGSEENKIRDAEGRLDIRNMTAPGFDALIRIPAGLAIQSGRADRSGPDPSPWLRMADDLLKQGLEIQVADLKARVPQGWIRADMTLRLEKDLGPSEILPFLVQPSGALTFFSLDARASLPRGVLKNESPWISPLYPGLRTGWLVPEADRLTHTSRIRDGRLFLNHNEVVLD